MINVIRECTYRYNRSLYRSCFCEEGTPPTWIDVDQLEGVLKSVQGEPHDAPPRVYVLREPNVR